MTDAIAGRAGVSDASLAVPAPPTLSLLVPASSALPPAFRLAKAGLAADIRGKPSP